MVGEDAKGVLEAQPEEQIDDDVLQKDDRGIDAVEHLHLGVDEQGDQPLDVLARDRHAAAQGRIEQAFRRQEALQRAKIAILGYGVGVFVRVGHARIEDEITVFRRVGANDVGDLADAVMRRAHESPDTLGERDVEDVDDRLRPLEAHRPGARLFLRHVVDAEELIVAEQQAVHLMRGRFVQGHRVSHQRRPISLPIIPDLAATAGAR